MRSGKLSPVRFQVRFESALILVFSPLPLGLRSTKYLPCLALPCLFDPAVDLRAKLLSHILATVRPHVLNEQDDRQLRWKLDRVAAVLLVSGKFGCAGVISVIELAALVRASSSCHTCQLFDRDCGYHISTKGTLYKVMNGR